MKTGKNTNGYLAEMMFKNFSIFRLFGFDIRLDASWFILAVLIFNTLTSHVLPGLYPGHGAGVYWLMALGSLVSLMASIIAHEIGHALVARHYRIPISYIVLYVFGGLARMSGPMPHPKADFLLAIAGPAMSAVMALLFYAAGHLITMLPLPATQVFLFMGYINLLLAVTNMIPALPLDGGRALRAVVWHVTKNPALATRCAGYLGYALATGIFAYGLYLLIAVNDALSGIWYMVMAYFLHGAASAAVKNA